MAEEDLLTMEEVVEAMEEADRLTNLKLEVVTVDSLVSRSLISEEDCLEGSRSLILEED
jgi:hypothetical protein